jgi:aminopeptidase N
VILDYDWRDEDLAHLLAHDSDPFNRWEAGQRLASRLILAAAEDHLRRPRGLLAAELREAARRSCCEHAGDDPAFAAEALTLPGEATLAEEMATVDPDALHAARNGLRRFVAEQLGAELLQCYDALATTGPYRRRRPPPDGAPCATSAWATSANSNSAESRAPWRMRQFASADNMTDQFAALAPWRRTTARNARRRWPASTNAGMTKRWWSTSGCRCRRRAVCPTRWRWSANCSTHPAFDLHNPNKVYALLNTFGNNHVRFHAADGSGYRFLAEQIGELDPLNPQVAARLARRFDRWRKFDSPSGTRACFAGKPAQQRTACRRTCARSSGEHCKPNRRSVRRKAAQSAG